MIKNSPIFIYEILIQPSMARMHLRKKGKASSKHPIERKHPKWGANPKEVEERIVKMAEEGKSPAMIGTILRDSYGVPDIKAATGKKLSRILKEHNLLPDVPEDLDNLLTKRERLKEHLSANPRNIHHPPHRPQRYACRLLHRPYPRQAGQLETFA